MLRQESWVEGAELPVSHTPEEREDEDHDDLLGQSANVPRLYGCALINDLAFNVQIGKCPVHRHFILIIVVILDERLPDAKIRRLHPLCAFRHENLVYFSGPIAVGILRFDTVFVRNEPIVGSIPLLGLAIHFIIGL